MKKLRVIFKLAALAIICSSIAGCDDVRVYGSVGYSNYNGYYGGPYGGGPRYGGSISVGGRIY